MEKNDIMMLNNILYRLYEPNDFRLTRKNLLNHIRMLVPFSYASILLSDRNPVRPRFTDPICVPEEFLPAERHYMEIAEKDHTLWAMDSDYAIIICESKLLPDHKRLTTPIYLECYSQYHIYDTLQVNIVYSSTFLGVLTLYRTRADGAFTEDDLFYMRMLSSHLNRLFFQKLLAADNTAQKQAHLNHLQKDYALTGREKEILALLLDGRPENDISQSLSIAPSTLKKHMQHIYQKLNISTRWELLRFQT